VAAAIALHNLPEELAMAIPATMPFAKTMPVPPAAAGAGTRSRNPQGIWWHSSSTPHLRADARARLSGWSYPLQQAKVSELEAAVAAAKVASGTAQ
jgi:hypothetical protein